jgi:integrase
MFCKKKWPVFEYLKAQKEKSLPCVLNRDEVLQVLQQVHTFHNYAYLTTVYTCGLRLQDALYLQTSDIDAKRMMIHVHRGKGAKDRYVPLPEETLALLRKYWATHRNPLLIFPALGRGTRMPPNPKPPWPLTAFRVHSEARKMAWSRFHIKRPAADELGA